MFGSLGFWEILLIFLVIALLFGGKKLPQLGKGIGEGIRNFKNALSKERDREPEKNSDKNKSDEKVN